MCTRTGVLEPYGFSETVSLPPKDLLMRWSLFSNSARILFQIAVDVRYFVFCMNYESEVTSALRMMSRQSNLHV